MNLVDKFKAELNNKTFALISCMAMAYGVFITTLLFTHQFVFLAFAAAPTASIVGSYWMGFWPPVDGTVQFGHAFGGYAIVLTPLLWGGNWKHLLTGIMVMLAFTTVKEYVFDPLVEKAAVRNGWTDQLHYLIGSGIALIPAWIAITTTKGAI